MLAVSEIGDNLKRLRRMNALTQEELAAKAGITAATLVRIERGQVEEPHVSTIRKLAHALGVEPRELVRQ